MIANLLRRIACLIDGHEPDDYPRGLCHCVHCGEGPLLEDDDWAAELFEDEEIL